MRGLMYQRWNSVWATALWLCSIAAPGKADDPQTPPQEIKSLISKLGDSSFAVREAATTTLTEMDVSIRPALEEAAKNRDAEIRSRARKILSIVIQRDFQRRLAEFSADVDGAQQVDLPGWSRFQTIVGSERRARELFIEIERAEPRILQATESKLESVNELLADRLREVFQATQFGGTATLGSSSAAALVFVASDPQVKLSSDVANLVSMLAYQPAVYSAINGSRGEELKKLLEAWVMRETDDASLLAQNVLLALNQNLSVGRELAISMLKKDNVAPHVAQQAMSLLARSGKKEDAALLARFLKDESVLANYNTNEANRDVLKVCDYAMAMMISLTANKPQDFYEGPLRWGQGWNAEPQSLAFRTEEDRQGALKKWKAWWAAHDQQGPDGTGETPTGKAGG